MISRIRRSSRYWRPEDIEREEAERAQREKEGVAETAEGDALSKSAAKRRRRAERARNAGAEAAAEEMEPEVLENGDMEAADDDEGWEQPTGKRAAKARAPKSPKFNFKPAEEEVETELNQVQEKDDQEEDGGVKVTEEEVRQQIHEQVAEQVQDQVHDQVQDQVHEQLANKDQEQLESQAVEQAEKQIEEQVQEQVQEQLQEQLGEQGLIEKPATIEVSSASLHIEQDAEVTIPSEPQPEPATQESTSQEPTLEQDMASLCVKRRFLCLAARQVTGHEYVVSRVELHFHTTYEQIRRIHD